MKTQELIQQIRDRIANSSKRELKGQKPATMLKILDEIEAQNLALYEDVNATVNHFRFNLGEKP